MQRSKKIVNSSSNTTLPNHILAFRTISTLLAKIQQTDAPHTIDNLPEKGSSERQEIKILSALASFLVMDNEVIAVASKRNPDSVEGEVEVIINSHTDDGIQLIPSSQSSVGNIIQYLFSKNPRVENTTTTTFPVIKAPTPPPRSSIYLCFYVSFVTSGSDLVLRMLSNVFMDIWFAHDLVTDIH
jgi:hypothetical protein